VLREGLRHPGAPLHSVGAPMKGKATRDASKPNVTIGVSLPQSGMLL
jgi:hypothetical protein